MLRDRNDRPATPPGFVDDASGLDETRVAEVVPVLGDPAAAEAQLSSLVRRAQAGGLSVSVAGARHSMGGHTIRPGGIVLDMLPLRGMRLDEGRGLLHVQAGARWSEVLPYLNARGRSVGVMQSNNSFTVGGSLSVNCHGWQPNRPPIASTVEGFRVLGADGRVQYCSRSENPELFSLALGGYGLFGVILDADLRVVPNEAYRLDRFLVSSDRYLETFRREVKGRADAGMAYGRLSVAPQGFLEEAILNVYRRVPTGAGEPPPLEYPEIRGLTRAIVRGQVGSDYGKTLRWLAEKRLEGALSSGPVYRNQLFNSPTTVLEDRSAAGTDILHEYFLPPASFGPFVSALRAIVRRHHGDLLNVTLRDLVRDDDTLLRYADQDMVAFVLLFHQARTPEGEASMKAMTRDLIDAALRGGGRHYLPYRLHATPAQLAAAYPQASRFFDLKRRYDPRETFQNAFYLEYGGPHPTPAPQ
jgi:FAD/FMN-containing dehydrogenase